MEHPGELTEGAVNRLSSSFWGSTSLGVGVVLWKLFVISGYSTNTAIAILGRADLFSLMMSLALSTLPLLLSGCTAVALVLVATRTAASRPLTTQLLAMGVVLVLGLAVVMPASRLLFVPPVLGLLSVGTAIASRITGNRHTLWGLWALVGATLTAVGILSLSDMALQADPIGTPRVYGISGLARGTDKLDGYVVGYPLSEAMGQTSILMYQPREVVDFPLSTITSSETCSLHRKDAGPPVYVTLLNRSADGALPSREAQLCFPEH